MGLRMIPFNSGCEHQEIAMTNSVMQPRLWSRMWYLYNGGRLLTNSAICPEQQDGLLWFCCNFDSNINIGSFQSDTTWIHYVMKWLIQLSSVSTDPSDLSILLSQVKRTTIAHRILRLVGRSDGSLLPLHFHSMQTIPFCDCSDLIRFWAIPIPSYKLPYQFSKNYTH